MNLRSLNSTFENRSTFGKIKTAEMKRGVAEIYGKRAGSFFFPFNRQIMTADCVPVVRKNILATNGVIHLIDGVLDPSRSRQIKAVTALTMDTRFTEFSR